MKLRQETIDVIINEVEPIKSLLQNQYGLSKLDVFNKMVELNLTCIRPYRGQADVEDYIDAASDHAITTIYFSDNKFILGDIEVYEDDKCCGCWEYEQIVNNEVEFNG